MNAPLTVVLMISLYAGRVISPKYSQVRLPKKAKGTEAK